jgi:hypothetical protein
MLNQLVAFIEEKNGIEDKRKLTKLVQEEFSLIRDRSVYYCDEFAIRFSKSKSKSFSNTVVSLSRLQKHDRIPFVVCLVTPYENIMMLGNSTFIKRVSHSSHSLRADNIKGSINGSDILRFIDEIENTPKNFDELLAIHTATSFEENLPRIVEATTGIVAHGKRFVISDDNKKAIFSSPERAKSFVESQEFMILNRELSEKVMRVKSAIIAAAFIENVNLRGRVVEYLIAGDDEDLRKELVKAIRARQFSFTSLKTDNELGDYERVFPDLYYTLTDVKSKIMFLSSNPKAYNIDKLFEFLANDRSVFMFYFVGINDDKTISTLLTSMFQTDVLRSTFALSHWAGRNSRGGTQLRGERLKELILRPSQTINIKESKDFLAMLEER